MSKTAEERARARYIRHACMKFIKDLSDCGVITDALVFEELDKTARLAGYQIEARQFGIQGTAIRFIPKEPGVVS